MEENQSLLFNVLQIILSIIRALDMFYVSLCSKGNIIVSNTIITINLDYSRFEVAADARHRVRSCGRPLQVPCNKADAARSARPKGRKCRCLNEFCRNW